MPQANKSGTAWDKKIEDYLYLCQLGRPGLAWEFLRRNSHYENAYRTWETSQTDRLSCALIQQEECNHAGPLPFVAWGLVRFRRSDIVGFASVHLLGWTDCQPRCVCALHK
jgi:Family of unknown function (DUF6499)